MKVLFCLIVCIAVYYFMKKKLQEKYNIEFVRRIKWIIRTPVLQVILLGASMLASCTIFIEYLGINIDSSDFLGAYYSNSYLMDSLNEIDYAKRLIRSSQYFDSLGVIAFIASILALPGLVLFIIMIVKQIRGIFGISDGHKVKKAYSTTLVAYTIVTFCSMIYYLNLAMCVSDSGDNSGTFTGYIGFFARLILFAILLIIFWFVRKKYDTAVDLFFGTREQETASNAIIASPNASCSNENSKTKQLLDLKALLDKGLLTQEEFDEEKRKILNA